MSKFNGVKARVMVSREVNEAKMRRAALAGAGGLGGATIGMLVGSVVGAAVTAATLLPKLHDGEGVSEDTANAVTAIGANLGAGAGAVVGFAIGTMAGRAIGNEILEEKKRAAEARAEEAFGKEGEKGDPSITVVLPVS
jgi:hypothetical protein